MQIQAAITLSETQHKAKQHPDLSGKIEARQDYVFLVILIQKVLAFTFL